MKLYNLLICLILVFGSVSCGKKDQSTEPDLNCGADLCVSAERMNGEQYAGFDATTISYQMLNGYAVAIWRDESTDPPAEFMMRVGSRERPVFHGSGTFMVDQYNTAFMSFRMVRDSLVTFKSYAGFIQVDSASSDYFTGSFKLDAQVDSVANYLRFRGKFNIRE